jgi:hypothetical protein
MIVHLDHLNLLARKILPGGRHPRFGQQFAANGTPVPLRARVSKSACVCAVLDADR